jgi:hypothetical protein
MEWSHSFQLKMANIRVLELLRRASSFHDLKVESCFKSIGSSGDHAGDMGNAQRFLAWALQQLFELRNAHDDTNEVMLLLDVQLVAAWVCSRTASMKVSATRSKKKFEEQLEDLINLGYCKEEIFGDSEIGDRMQTGRIFVDRALKLSNVWCGFQPIAQQLQAACIVLANFDRPLYEAFVDIDSLPTFGGRPYPAFVTALADELMGGLEIHCRFGEHELTLIPSGEQKQEVQGKHVILAGGVLATFTIDGFRTADTTPSVWMHCNGSIIQTTVRVERTPKATYIYVSTVDQVPVVRVVYKENTVTYGFCRPNNCREVGRWVSKDAFMALVTMAGRI